MVADALHDLILSFRLHLPMRLLYQAVLADLVEIEEYRLRLVP